MRSGRFVAFIVGACVAFACPAWAGTTAFDFDSCSPTLTPGMSTPLDQTCNAISAHFSSTHDGWQGGGYSVQTDGTTQWHMSQFSGNYLMPNGLDPGRLDISFGQSLTAITFTFATADFHQNEIPTTIQMDAYLDSNLVGSKQAHGTYGSDTMPMGTLTYNSGGQAFNRIEIWIPPQALGSSDVLVDNLAVTPVGNTGFTFVPVAPCRVVDTRQTHNPIMGDSSQDFAIPQLGTCNIPSSAVAYSLNVTVVPQRPLGYLTIWPTGAQQPLVSTLNSNDARIKANAAIVPAGTNGAVSVYATDTTDLILDIDGYFSAAGSYQFYPRTPCRVVDTRNPIGTLGGPPLGTGQTRDFPVLQSSCLQGISPKAYAFNVTVVPNPGGHSLNFLTLWPKGQPQPVVSTLNNPTATEVANAAIVAAGTGGNIEVYAYDRTDLILDVAGYFATPSSGGLSMYTLSPCRVIDTRDNHGQPFTHTLSPPVNVVSSPCALPSAAKAYVLNATVVPTGSLGYLTLWPNGELMPLASTLNASDHFITSNLAIVPTNDGIINAYADGLTHLILDISGYFAP